jgi:glutathione synthase/RimK-type ligase-like ATP-grasp enzyme
MVDIYALTDYQGYFESKYDSIPYISGMDKKKLEAYFFNSGYRIVFMGFSEITDYPGTFWADKLVIYTSSEDTGYFYKSFIEDVIYYLELSNAIVIPSFKYLRANNNKVFMELLRYNINDPKLLNIKSKVFGCLEEAENVCSTLSYPVILKQSSGAMSKGVGLAGDKDELIRKLKRVARTRNIFREMWEYGRSIKYKSYKKESRHRKKYILQDFIKNLTGDYKVLVFSDNYYVLKRGIKAGDFRASGSGIRIFERNIPDGLLQFAFDIFKDLNIPNASLDIAFNGSSFFLIEFQCLYFGSYTLTFSDFYWKRNANVFQFIEGKSELERVYAGSIVNFIKSL